ncbi:hypothetical protein K438DRAFT_1934434 [Mycena galopus ATCC 62051]|nr:hypothetical protein K438DRAFT_1934434 [Mycena galopus ATCC 62051]
MPLDLAVTVPFYWYDMAWMDVPMWSGQSAAAVIILGDAFPACGLGVSVATNGMLYLTEVMIASHALFAALSSLLGTSFQQAVLRRGWVAEELQLFWYTQADQLPQRHQLISQPEYNDALQMFGIFNEARLAVID